jgi:hypothetical protein
LPGLGGFVVQSQQAGINRGKTRIKPPSRNAAFNSLLNHDDGLLTSTLARAEHLSYPEAAAKVQDFAMNCKKQISNGEISVLEGIGELYAGTEGEIIFRPYTHLNFHSGVYGMGALSLHPLTQQGNQARITKKHADRKPVYINERRPASVKWTLILSAPVILFLLYGIFFPASFRSLYTNYSGLIPGFQHSRAIEQKIVRPVEVKAQAEPSLAVVPDKPELVTEIPDQDNKTAISSKNTTVPSMKYYIIGGCFENEKNAGKFLEELISRGFEAERAGVTNRGYIRISYKSFNDRSSALPYLQKIRSEENASAWLLKF